MTLDHGSRIQRESNELLKREPAIARVVANDGTKDCVSYVCRATPPNTAGSLDLVSQRAPKGRLASLPIGGVLRLQSGKVLTVLSRTELHPTETGDGCAMGYRTEFLRYPLCNYAVHVRGFGYWDIDFLRLELHSATEELFKAMANRPNDGDPQESLGRSPFRRPR
ncbi:MAG: helicase UvrD [Edaphobacter sp.]|nr:helicase UvrD [Edaphobacter sp.]